MKIRFLPYHGQSALSHLQQPVGVAIEDASFKEVERLDAIQDVVEDLLEDVPLSVEMHVVEKSPSFVQNVKDQLPTHQSQVLPEFADQALQGQQDFVGDDGAVTLF